jgi:hypothetical protein
VTISPAKTTTASSSSSVLRDSGASGASRIDADGGSSSEAERLYAIAGQVEVVEKPAAMAPLLGTIRAGGSVELSIPTDRVAADAGCSEGRYAVVPRGFVCADRRTTRNPLDPAVKVLKEYGLAPHAALPASYGIAEVSPLYLRLPTWEEQLRSEPGIEEHLHKRATMREAQGAARAWGDVSAGQDPELEPAGLDLPDELRAGALAPFAPKRLLPNSPVTGFLSPGARVAWVAEFDALGRTWLLTPDLLFVPRDKVKRSLVSGWRGVEVPDGQGIAFVGHRAAHRYRRSTDAKRFVVLPDGFAPNTAVLLAALPSGSTDERFLESDGGVLVRADEVIVVPASLPARFGLDGQGRWVEVIAKANVLLLHEGARVVFATLVSGGFDTRRGKFRITAKHLTLPPLFEQKRAAGSTAEVPEVMVATETTAGPPASALFAGWWMSSWGSSHGGFGVALSPLDARRVFDFVSPDLPEGWHSVRGEGTWVVVHD